MCISSFTSPKLFVCIYNSFPAFIFLFALGTRLWQTKMFALGTPLRQSRETLHEWKTIQCLPNPLQHVPIYLQQFPSYSNRKCKKSQCTAAHIFVSPEDAPAIITQYVAWMERQFYACQTPRIMYLSIFNSFRVIRCLSQCVSPKIDIFTTFWFPLWTPLKQSR